MEVQQRSREHTCASMHIYLATQVRVIDSSIVIQLTRTCSLRPQNVIVKRIPLPFDLGRKKSTVDRRLARKVLPTRFESTTLRS